MHPRHPNPGGSRYRPSCDEGGGGRHIGARYSVRVEMQNTGTSHCFDRPIVGAGIRVSSPEANCGDQNSIPQDSLSKELEDSPSSSGVNSVERLTPRFVKAEPSERKYSAPCKQLCAPRAAESRVEVSPGVFSPLRGSAETWEAILGDMYLPSTCFWCTTTVFAIQDCGFVLCPRCGAVYPTEGEMIDRIASGVGLGFTFESLARWQPEIESHRRNLCNCGALPIQEGCGKVRTDRDEQS